MNASANGHPEQREVQAPRRDQDDPRHDHQGGEQAGRGLVGLLRRAAARDQGHGRSQVPRVRRAQPPQGVERRGQPAQQVPAHVPGAPRQGRPREPVLPIRPAARRVQAQAAGVRAPARPDPPRPDSPLLHLRCGDGDRQDPRGHRGDRGVLPAGLAVGRAEVRSRERGAARSLPGSSRTRA
jgi:hypothetical protein